MNSIDLKISKLITENIFNKNIYLDLSNLLITDLPIEIYELKHLEGIYLSNNKLSSIPLQLFENFPKLKILDLRFNNLNELPQEIAHLRLLEIILLDGNNISHLPSKMGSLINIKGLNIGSNPLIDPCLDIVKHGYKAILSYLNGGDKNLFQISHNDLNFNKCNDDCIDDDKEANIVNSYKFFKPKIYKEIHQSYLNKNRKGSSLKPKEMITQTDKHNSRVNLFPEPVSLENIERKMIEQKRLEKIKEVKQKREAELQKIKNKTTVKEWQDETKSIQSLKIRQQGNKLPLEIKFESDDRILKAPFKVEKQFLETISGEELDHQKFRTIKDTPRPQPIDREIQLELEAERRNRQNTIQSDIRKHGEYLVKKKNMPKGSAKEELEAAKRDMEILAMLRRSLMSSGSVFKPF